MMALDLQPGDEVITPSFTYIATTEVIALLKLKPVFGHYAQDKGHCSGSFIWTVCRYGKNYGYC
jgi:dTDP-4-amino-4,6-dideoxygalactose transaminase